MFKKKNSKLSFNGEHLYFNYVSVEEICDDIIISFKQLDNNGIINQYRVVMNIVSAKLINGIIADVIEEFEKIEYKIKRFPNEKFSHLNNEIKEIDYSLHYVNHITISSSPISFILEYLFEGPDEEQKISNIIVKPELAKYIYLETQEFIDKYEASYGEINLEDYLI